MSVFKDTFSVALDIIPNDNTNIPFPNVVKTGTTDGVATNQLRDTGAQFIQSGIQVGDIVYNGSSSQYAYVTGVEDDRLYLSADIFISGELYQIFQGVNQGCYIYIGDTASGDVLEVVTLGGNTVSFFGLKAGTILPVQVLKVTSGTNAVKLIALW